jgi:diguanylate cyclase (GGDEF)-like protein/PAS domain S-box-containing protein
VRFSSTANRSDVAQVNARDFFVHHQTTARDTAYLGRPYRAAPDGQWVVPLSRRIANRDGGFGGAVVAAVDIDRIHDYLTGFDVGRSGSLTLMTRDGIVVTRLPATPDSIGFDARSGDMVAILDSAGQTATTTLVSVFDGVPRQISLDRGRHYPFIVVAAKGKAEALAGWARAATVSGAVLLSLLVLLAWLARSVLASARREKIAADALAASHRRLEDIERAVREHAVIAVTDARGRIVDVNQRFCELSGYPRDELLGQTHKIVNSGLHPPEFFHSLWRTISGGAVWRGVITNRNKRGEVYHVDSTIVPLRGADGRPERYIAVRTDVTELRHLAERLGTAMQNLERANVELEQLAWIDGLTLLANRRRMDEAIAAELSRAQRAASPLSLLLIDVDRFKLFNDHYGHSRGDDCLRRVGAALKQAERRSGDLAGRWGGEEFVLLLPQTDGPGAAVVADALRQAIEGLGIPHRDHDAGCVTVSIGVASVDVIDGHHSVSQLVERADRALYRAKHAGRNRVCVDHADTAHAEPGAIADQVARDGVTRVTCAESRLVVRACLAAGSS